MIENLEDHLRRVTEVLSEEVDKIYGWDDDQQRTLKFGQASRKARLNDLELPPSGLIVACPERQRVKAQLILKMTAVDLGSNYQNDPRTSAFRALAKDLLLVVPENDEVQLQLAVGLGVARSFPTSVATDTVKAWARGAFPVMQSLAKIALEAINRHNDTVDLVVQEQRTAMTRAEELTTELQGFATE